MQPELNAFIVGAVGFTEGGCQNSGDCMFHVSGGVEKHRLFELSRFRSSRCLTSEAV